MPNNRFAGFLPLILAGTVLTTGFFVANEAEAGVGLSLVADSTGTVYLIDGGQRRPFRSPEVFFSNGFSFSQVAQATGTDLALPVGPIMIFRDGTLIKGPGDPLVYLVTNGIKRPFQSADDFHGLGYSFFNIVTANVETFADLPVGAVVSEARTGAAHPVGSLINDNGAIFLITPNGRSGFTSAEDFRSHGYGFNQVVPANTADRALGLSANAGMRVVNETQISVGPVVPPVPQPAPQPTPPIAQPTPPPAILSPSGGENFVLGRDTINVRWSPTLPGVDVIKLVAVSGNGSSAQLYGQNVQGYPTNKNGYYDYKLPNDLSFIQPGIHYIELTPVNGYPVKSSTFTISSPVSTVPPVSGVYSVASLDGYQSTYNPNSAITFKVKGLEPDGTSASQSEGFNVQAHLYDPAVGRNPSFQAVNATFDTSTGLWTVQLSAPVDKNITYEVRVSLYCGYVGLDSLCVQKYGTNKEQFKTFQFRVADTAPQITVLSPNGGEQWALGSTQTIRWYDANSANQTYTIHITSQNGSSYGVVGNVYNKTEFSWFVGNIPSGSSLRTGTQYYVQIVKQYTGTNSYDQSDAPFTILAATNQASVSSSPSSLSFSAAVGGNNPAQQYITIINNSATAANWSVSESASWLTVGNGVSGSITPYMSNSAFPLTANIDISGLTGGTYSTSVAVSGNFTTLYIPVTVTVNAQAYTQASLSSSPSSLSFSAAVGGNNPAQQTLILNNNSGVTANWSFSESASWLTVGNGVSGSITPYMSNSAFPLTANINISGLTAGTYNTSIAVTGNFTTIYVPVTVTVNPAQPAPPPAPQPATPPPSPTPTPPPPVTIGYYQGPISTSSIVCGDTYSFIVTNAGSQIWLIQYKGIVLQYNGVYSSSSSYTSKCNQDEGTYNASVYSVIDGGKGNYLGGASLTIGGVQGMTMLNQPPIAPTVTGPNVFKAGTAQNFNGYSLDPEGAPITYSINWGDGLKSSQSFGSGYPYEATHAWSAPGAYSITINASDAAGNSRSTAVGITVN